MYGWFNPVSRYVVELSVCLVEKSCNFNLIVSPDRKQYQNYVVGLCVRRSGRVVCEASLVLCVPGSIPCLLCCRALSLVEKYL